MATQNIKTYCIIGFSCCMLLFSACKKEIETEPAYVIMDELVWDELDSLGTLAGWFLNDIYTYLPTGFNRINSDFLDAGTDDALPSRNNTTVQYFTNGRISTFNNPDVIWGSCYFGIRRVNIYLANIYKVPNQNLQTFGKAEARFLRAMFYFELLKRHGGVPLIGDKIYTLEDDLQIPRNTFEECVNYIVAECDAIKGQLRKEAIADGDWGHAPRGAAYALKSRVLLYAASPLSNGGGIESTPALKALTGYLTYDANRWQKALDAADSLIALNYYKLPTNVTFGTMFTTKKNEEVIFSKQRGNTFDIETINAPVGYGSPAQSNGYTSPTQELVDAFPMLNGMGINEAGSGYNPADPYNPRDPRLKLTVFYNGLQWLTKPVETYNGGKDRPGGNVIQTKTGYYLRKFMGDFSSNTTYTNQNHNFIFFRFAEILLNRAEALNELGRTADAYAPLKDIRKRAGITAGAGTMYGLKASMTQDEMRIAIQNERRIELAFEEHRFWDVRRWKLGSTVLNSPVHGINITKNPSNGTLTFNVVEVAKLTFQPKMYHMPIPYAEVSKNANLIQNEGW